jgi:hypothetical protein
MATLKFRRFVGDGAPLFLLCVGGLYVFSKITSGGIEIRDRNRKSMGQKDFNLEEEHKAIKFLSTDFLLIGAAPNIFFNACMFPFLI